MTIRELELELFNLSSHNPVIIRDVNLKKFDDDIIFAFNGRISYNILSLISNSLKDELKNVEGTKKELFNIYFIFMELVQNIMNYSIDRSEHSTFGSGTCFVIRNRKDKHFTVSSGNMFLSEYTSKIIEKIEKINSLDNKDLKNYHKELRRNGKDTHDKGGGLGFIEIAKKSTEKIIYDIIEIDSTKSYIEITINI